MPLLRKRDNLNIHPTLLEFIPEPLVLEIHSGYTPPRNDYGKVGSLEFLRFFDIF